MASKRGGDIVYKSRRAPDPLKYVGCVASGRAPVWIRIEAGADEIFELWILVRYLRAEVLKWTGKSRGDPAITSVDN